MSDKPESPFHARSRATGSLIGLCGLALFLAISRAVGEGIGTIASAAMTCLAMVVCISWSLRKQLWFWVAIIVLTCLHVFAIMLVDWSAAAHWTGLSLMPVMWADVSFMLVVIFVLYRCIYGAPARLVEDIPDRYSERDIL
jgi:hypothetical protein